MTRVSTAVKRKKAEDFQPKRGRPTQTQIVAIEQNILSVAREMFLRDGYATTTIDMVVAQARVSKGTVYARYPTKADLFHAIVEERIAAWGEEPDEATDIPEDADLREILFRSGMAIVNASLQPEVMAYGRLVAAESERFPELTQEFYKQGWTRMVDQLAVRIESGAQRSGWAVKDPGAVATAFQSILIGWCEGEARVRGAGAEARKAFVETVVSIFVDGHAAW